MNIPLRNLQINTTMHLELIQKMPFRVKSLDGYVQRVMWIFGVSKSREQNFQSCLHCRLANGTLVNSNFRFFIALLTHAAVTAW